MFNKLYGFPVLIVLSIFLILSGCKSPDGTNTNSDTVPTASLPASGTPTNESPLTTTPSYGGAIIPALEGEGPYDIWLGDYEARPNVLIVEKGAIVTWTNQDFWKPVTVVSDDGLFAANVEPTGGTFSYQFDDPGTFGYTIDPYSGVWQGVVIVTE